LKSFYVETFYSIDVLLVLFFDLKVIVRLYHFCLLDQTRIVALVSGLILKD